MDDQKLSNALFVLNDRGGLEVVSRVGESVGFNVVFFETADEFLDSAVHQRPVAVFLDLVMDETDGVEVIRKLSESRYKGKVGLFTETVDEKVLLTAFRLGKTYGLDMIEPFRLPFVESRLQDLFQSWWKANYSISRQDLTAAIQDKQLRVYYQPKVQLDLSSGSTPITEVEALVRWIHPQLGIVSPGLFIPLAEQSGLIGSLTDEVIALALQQIRDWAGVGLKLDVGVNLSLHSLNDLTFPDRLEDDCNQLEVLPSNLILEITETAAMGNSPVLPDVLTRLRLKGFALAMDDFGTGYSSLVQLYRMPFSELKIDQSFLMESDRSDEARIIIRSIMNLAQNLGLMTCAEGVETASAVEFCRSIGCEKLQGYIVSKPLPADEIARFITHWDADLGLLTR